MVVGIDEWATVRRSLMDVAGFPQGACRPYGDENPLRRSDSLLSMRSLCSTSLSESDPEEIPLVNVPEEDEEEDWRMFGWLLDSSQAADPFNLSIAADAEGPVKPASPSDISMHPLSPISVQIDEEVIVPSESSSECSENVRPQSDLLKIDEAAPQRRYVRASRRPWWARLSSCDSSSEEASESSPASSPARKRASSYCSNTTTDDSEDEEVPEDRRVTRAMSHYLEIKRSRRIGATPVDEEPSIPEATPEPSPAAAREAYYYAGPEIKVEDNVDDYLGYFNQVEEPEEENPSLPASSNTGVRSVSCESVQDVKPEIVRHSPRQPIKSSKYTSSPIDMSQPPFVPSSTSINRIPRLIQSIKPAGVAIISAKKHREFRKAKPGRPSNKEKRRLERKAAAELKKMSKRSLKHPTDEIDMNACHCMCRKPFDVKKFYLACNKCFRWFHGRCVGLTEKRASRMATWECPECNPNFVVKPPSRRQTSRAKSQSHDVNADYEEGTIYEADPEPPEDIVNNYIYPRSLYCLCHQEYIETEFYVGCEYCDNWFHPVCVGITRAAAEKMAEYVCPNCQIDDPNVVRLSPQEHRLVFNAIVALFKVPGNELFRRDTEAGRPYREACPNFPVIEEFCHRHNDFAYAQLSDFSADLDAFESAVHSFFGNRSHHGTTASKMVRIAKRRLQPPS